jgi:hypothetical protein
MVKIFMDLVVVRPLRSLDPENQWANVADAHAAACRHVMVRHCRVSASTFPTMAWRGPMQNPDAWKAEWE